jgi:hypothetical protein
MGPKGGISYVNDNGRRTYVSRDAPRHSGSLTSGIHISSGTANGSQLFTRQRGGTYYINSAGKKNISKKITDLSKFLFLIINNTLAPLFLLANNKFASFTKK